MPEKQNNDERVLRPDLELLNHQYSDFYPDYYMYDVREIDYPIYRTKILFEYTKGQEIHTIIISVLKTIQFLESVRNVDAYSELQNITQLDKEILDSILAEMTTKGYLKQNELKLSANGKEILEKEKELVTEKTSAYLNFDGIFGTCMGDDGKINQNNKYIRNIVIQFHTKYYF